MPHVGFRTVYYRDNGLRRAPAILAKHLRGSLEGIGKRLRTSSIQRMRRDTGNEQKSLFIKVGGKGINLELRVMSTLVQAFTDAYGMKRGTFPPFGPNSRIFRWALRKESEFVPSKWDKTKERGRGRTRKQIKKIKSPKGLNLRQSKHVPVGRRAQGNAKVRRIAFLVARKIYRQGIRPTHWNKLALDANRQRITRDIQNGLQRAAREITKG